MEKVDINNLEDVKLFVNDFYRKVREDELLKDVFDNVLHDRWDTHLEKMYTFWQTVLLGEYTYKGTPFPPHAPLPVQAVHFERWVTLFNATIDEFFVGERAEQAKWQGSRMAEMFLSKINYYRENNFQGMA